jgi:hypothetical protein
MSTGKKRCLFCGQDVAVEIDRKVEPVDAQLLEQKEAMCQACARTRGLNPDEKYFVFAGAIYQKFSNVYLKLWPVGTFH